MVCRCASMTDTQQYTCPISDCEYSSGSDRSVENHINGSTTGDHEGASGADYRGEIQTVDVDPDDNRGDDSKSGDGTDVEPVEFPESDRGEPADNRGDDPAGADCCDDPDLEGEQGMVVVGESTDQGQIKRLKKKLRTPIIQLDRPLEQPQRLETGDEVCMTCDTIHE